MKAGEMVEKSKKGHSKIMIFVISLVFVLIGATVIPLFIKKCSEKLYKAADDGVTVDLDNLGPKIVRKNPGNDAQ
ncbi:MAG: hypothetical protein LKJ44_02310 [Bifidobacteriaceae bacterium]|nr:hypothetical protein [Bifidobacteriaceae bacterium]MCI1978537.1 hypothetical protein [Bifidobacteriaceae bacterium]